MVRAENQHSKMMWEGCRKRRVRDSGSENRADE